MGNSAARCPNLLEVGRIDGSLGGCKGPTGAITSIEKDGAEPFSDM